MACSSCAQRAELLRQAAQNVATGRVAQAGQNVREVGATFQRDARALASQVARVIRFR